MTCGVGRVVVIFDLRACEIQGPVMRKLADLALVLIAVVNVAGCKNAPGANVQYATHDHGRDNRP